MFDDWSQRNLNCLYSHLLIEFVIQGMLSTVLDHLLQTFVWIILKIEQLIWFSIDLPCAKETKMGKKVEDWASYPNTSYNVDWGWKYFTQLIFFCFTSIFGGITCCVFMLRGTFSEAKPSSFVLYKKKKPKNEITVFQLKQSLN